MKWLFALFFALVAAATLLGLARVPYVAPQALVAKPPFRLMKLFRIASFQVAIFVVRA